MKALAQAILPRTVGIGLALSGVLCITRAWSEEPAADGVVLRPLWQPGKSYRLQQQVEATAEIPGLGEPAFGWHQLMTVTPAQTAEGLVLDLGLEVIRVDFDLEGERSRYYFRQGDAKRYQGSRGFPGRWLADLESLVDQRCRLAVDAQTGVTSLSISPALPADAPPPRDAVVDDGLGRVLQLLPWEGLTNALLHQGIPEDPKKPGDTWPHRNRLAFEGAEGHLETDLDCRFEGYKTIGGRELALIAFRGSVDLRIRPAPTERAPEDGALSDAAEEAANEPLPRIDLDVPRINGLTLIDPQQRAIVSTVIKVDGKVKHFGRAEFAGRHPASFENTITLSLLTVEDLKE